MSLYIPEDVLQNVRESAGIRQIVGEYVTLKKSGRNWVGLCPFHSDQDPSFSINEDKQIFYCFGCGEGGDVFKFLMKMQGVSFVEAVKSLADRFGIVIPEKAPSRFEADRRAEKDALLAINNEAAEFYHWSLTHASEGLEAKAYLARRGLSEEIIVRFGVGWAPDRWEALIQHFASQAVDLAMAEKAGLVVPRDRGPGHYDRFRGRVIFPIADRSGRTVALGGRILGDGHPKYLNSPESPVYHKGNVLYGLSQNKGAIRQAGRGFVVEGYMDLLSLVQGGVGNVVATLGTALTPQHVLQMKSLCRDWVLVFDGDPAGLKAALRALPLFYEANLRVRVMTLPAQDDPDTYIQREGQAAWERLAAQASSGIDFVMAQGASSHGSDAEGRHETTEEVLAVLGAVGDPVRKSLLAGHVAQKLGVREESLWERLSGGPRVSSQPVSGPASPAQAPVRRAKANKAEEKLLGFLLAHPQYLESFVDAGLDIWLENGELLALWRSMMHVHALSGHLDPAALSDMLEGQDGSQSLVRRLLSEFPPCDSAGGMAKELLRYCDERRKKALRRDLLTRLKDDGREVDGVEILRHFQQLR